MASSSADLALLTPEELRHELARSRSQQAVMLDALQSAQQELKAQSAELAESLEYQTAISRVLGVISRSPSNLQPVLDAILSAAQELCRADRSSLWRLNGNRIELAAHKDHFPGHAEYLTRHPVPNDRTSLAGRVISERRTIHIEDRLSDAELPANDQARTMRARTMLGVPLLRDGQPIGTISLVRSAVDPFSARQINLIETFADQAVIAIENTRLFEEVQARTRELETKSTELQESLEYQTSTGNVLEVIARSQADERPVLEAIAAMALRLCDTYDVCVFLRQGDKLKLEVICGPIGGKGEQVFPLISGLVMGRSVLDARVIHVHDLRAAAGDYQEGYTSSLELGHRTILCAPLLQHGVAIGVIVLRRFEVRPFSDKQIALLQMFANQAVIAIENARLLDELQTRQKELETRGKELTESLEFQTATSEVLSVISRTPNQVQPVLDSIVEICQRLCEADRAQIFTEQDGKFQLAAYTNTLPETVAYFLANPLVPDSKLAARRALLEGQTVHVPDITKDPYYDEDDYLTRQGGARLAVPLISGGRTVGVIAMPRSAPVPFTHRQIALVETFADQAVIAIENARLFEAEQARTKELTESLEYQTAISEVLSVISRSPNEVKPVLDVVARNAARVCVSNDARVFLVQGSRLIPAASFGTMRPSSSFGEVPEVANFSQIGLPLSRGSVIGRAVVDGRTVHVHDLAAEPESEYPDGRIQQRAIGHRTTLATPLLRDGKPLGGILIRRAEVKPFTGEHIRLLETFADQAVIAIVNARLFEAEQTSKRELRESLEYQTATSEVLSVISRSPSQVQPVLDAIAGTAARLCSAEYAFIGKAGDSKIHLAAASNMDSEHARWLQQNPVSIDRSSATGRTALERRAIHITDILEDPEFAHRDWQHVGGQRTILGVPLLHEDDLVGVIMLVRNMVQPFSQRQIELVTTFADQAVIAIENTRLFEAEQASKRELQESLEYQTATSDVLNVISRSPTELQPVLDAIAATAARLCESMDATVWRVADERVRVAAQFGAPTNSSALPLTRGSVTGRAIVDRKTIHVHDLAALVETEYPEAKNIQRRVGHRTTLAMPLLSQGEALGAISVRKNHVHPFSEKQVALLQTFADQAVIAIENARLFEAEQTSKRELQEALEQQTATSNVLGVISSSPTDVQPVLNAIVKTAVMLCNSHDAVILLTDGAQLRIAAHYGPMAIDFESIPIGRETVAGRSIVDRVPVHVHDLAGEDQTQEFPLGQRIAVRLNQRTVLGLPLLREGQAIGCLFLRRTELLPFTEKQILLLQTFADQAVIAIENTRLFEEVQARNRDLTALGEVGRAVSSTLELKAVLKTIVDRAVELSGTDGGSIFYFREDIGRFELGETTGLDEGAIARFRKLDIAAGQTGLGEAIAGGKPLQVADIARRASNPLRDAALEAGLRAALIVPLLSAEAPLGALVLQRRQPGEFSDAIVTLMQSFADQSAIALENARLFEEIAQKSRELEIASAHKSQFVANMSHELRTPLAAILGYAELIQEGFYGPLPDKSIDALTRIRSNGKHLLGLINTVLDIAKIESGQFNLNLAEYALANVVETVRMATESLAETKKLALKTDVAQSLPIGFGDEQRLTQVLLNLVGNAIKFTEAGEVRITARTENGRFAVSVADTGPGIPADQLTRVFEQFHQVDNSNTKRKGGTGLGLAIAKQIIEMHGGRVWAESEPGKGATFLMQLPVRAESRKSLQ